MNTARKGRRKEYQVRDIIEREGYYLIRSAASKGFADLIAILRTDLYVNLLQEPVVGKPLVRLIQVKPGRFTAADRRKLGELRAMTPAVCQIEGWVVEDRKVPVREICLMLKCDVKRETCLMLKCDVKTT